MESKLIFIGNPWNLGRFHGIQARIHFKYHGMQVDSSQIPWFLSYTVKHEILATLNFRDLTKNTQIWIFNCYLHG